MGNSISGNGGTGTGVVNRPSHNYPLTVNSNDLQDGHYVCFYTNLDSEQINKICKSMDGVSTITDLTIIIGGARTSKKTVNSKYYLTSVKYKNDNKDDTTTTAESTNADTKVKSTDKQTNDNNEISPTESTTNDFGIIMDSSYYLIISSSLLETATNEQIDLKRSVNSTKYGAIIYIGSKYKNYVETYFDAYITDDFKNIESSKNPINGIKKRKIFDELPSVPSIYFKLSTLQSQYSSRYFFVSVCKLTTLSNGMSHIETIRNNANLMAIYYYSKSDVFLKDALKQFVYDEFTIETSNSDYNIFSVGHQSPNPSTNTVVFRGRTIQLNPSSKSSDFRLSFPNGDLIPSDISKGFQQGKRLFPAGITDNVTQIFNPSQTIILNRNDFCLYIGFVKTDVEIDLIGTLLNGMNIPKQKFILYVNDDVFGKSYKLPDGLYTTPNNGITNIVYLKSGVNVSDNYYLTLGIDVTSTIDNDDIVNVPGDNKLQLKTLRNNEVLSKQAIFGSHAGDMKTIGAYIPDSELLLPTSYDNDSRLVVVCALNTTPSAIWNMAKNMVKRYDRKNWILYFSLLNDTTINDCNGFTILDNDHNMKILYSTEMLASVKVKQSYSFEVLVGKEKVFMLSQRYINSSTRKNYISVFSLYPGKIPSTEPEYQQYKYSLVKNLSYINYEIQELQSSLKDLFIGGLSNNITLYANMSKFKKPVINQEKLTGEKGMYFDYFPTINSASIMQSYLSVFEDFMSKGSNSKIVRYTCLMRVRKEWIKNSPPNKTYFEVIEGENTDLCLIFMFGGTDLRYTYNSATKTFTLPTFQSIIFDSSIAKDDVPKSSDVYIANQLEKITPPTDELRHINAPISASFFILRSTITSYEQLDSMAFFFRKYTTDIGSFMQNGSIFQTDISFTRHTLLKQTWFYFVYMINTLLKKTTETNANCIIFLKVTTFDETNIAIPSLKTSLQNCLSTGSIEKSLTKPTTPSGVFKNFSVTYDNVNRIYIISNIDVVIGANSAFYTFNYGRMYINSTEVKQTTELNDGDLKLDLISNSFYFTQDSNIFSRVSYAIREKSESPPIIYPQVDKASKKSSGVTITSDNSFWSSVRAFVYIDDLSKFEVANLIDMTKYLYVNLNRLFIISLVSYDITSPDSWVLNKCVVIRGNDKTTISMNLQNDNKYYYIKLNDPNVTTDFMKFGIWNSTADIKNSDLENLDFIVNKQKGTTYDGNMQILSNERIGIVDNFINFTFPKDTMGSFPKFNEFTTKLNKYILFVRPIEKNVLSNLILNNGIAVLELNMLTANDQFDFSEIINYVVQWRALSKNQLQRVIIFMNRGRSIKRPNKEYKLEIDGLSYNTSEFTFTDNPDVIIFPKCDYNKLDNSWILADNAYYLNPTFKTTTTNNNVNYAIYSGPTKKQNNIDIYIGPQSKYKQLSSNTSNYLNMSINIKNVITKI